LSLRDQFPILQREVNGYPLVYLDNAATTQKPQVVLDAMSHYYAHSNANVPEPSIRWLVRPRKATRPAEPN